MHIKLFFLLIVLQIFDWYAVNCMRCRQKYSTKSKGIGKKNKTQNKIFYSLSDQACNKSNHDHVSPPKITNLDWRIEDPSTNGSSPRILLDLQWRPTQDISLEYLKGFKITIANHKRLLDKSIKPVFVCLDTKLDFDSHAFASFTYKCYGMTENSRISPGDRITVNIDPLPPPYRNTNHRFVNRTLNIPSCNKPQMYQMKECVLKRATTVTIDKISCHDKSIVFSYSLPAGCGDSATLLLCRLQENLVINCLDNPVIQLFNQSLSATKRFVLPTTEPPSMNYTIVINSNGQSSVPHTPIQTFKQVSLQLCKSTISNVEIVVGLTVLAVFTGLVLAVIVFFCWKKQCLPGKTRSLNSSIATDSLSINEPLIISDYSKKVYLLFMSDHPLHEQVVLAFANFLHEDLGFDVICELWEQNSVIEDKLSWMNKAMDRADKVLVIWSYRSVECWNESKTFTDLDMFTPNLRRIQRDLCCDKNVGKYLFCYFDYFSKSDIPKLFYDNLPCCHFRLMKQFEDLYFQINDIEKYNPGSVVRNEQIADYANQELNPHGKLLKDSVEAMCDMVKENPNWYTDDHGCCEAGGGGFVHPSQKPIIIKRPIEIVPPPPLENYDTGFEDGSFLPPTVTHENSFNDNEELSEPDDHIDLDPISFIPPPKLVPINRNVNVWKTLGDINNINTTSHYSAGNRFML
ncbi:interleukin-17 receptor A-like [Ciona intestinalis]